jgi:hypothetical protein
MAALVPSIHLLICCALVATSVRPVSPPHIRTVDDIIACALSHGYARSTSFRGLVDGINTSNVIVYIDRDPGNDGFDGRTRFLGAAGGHRYLRITVERGVVNDALIALLGHELRHVGEVAETSWVVDEASYRALYRLIGHPSSPCRRPGWCFDTASATESGYRVLSELRRGVADIGPPRVRRVPTD